MTPETLADYRAELRFLLREQHRISSRVEELQRIVEWPPKQVRA